MMPFELTVVDTQNLSAQTVETINNQVTSLVNRHANNSCEINRLVFEGALALTAADKSAKQKAAFGFFKRNFTGALNQTQNDINRELTAAQYAAQQILLALANQNKLSFDLIAAVNNKLNAAMLDVNNEINEIYDTMRTFFNSVRAELIRLGDVKQRVELLTWQNSIEYQQYNGVEYQDLDDAAKIVCLVRDFYDITKGKWNTTDLLLLKTAMATIGLNPKDKVRLRYFAGKVRSNSNLRARLFGENTQFATENERVPFALKAANPAQLPDATAPNYEFILELLCNSKQLEYAKEIHTKLLKAKEFFLACKIQEALPLLQETANAGESEARYMLATIYKNGLADKKDAQPVALLTAGTVAEENPDVLKKRADDGDVFAQYEMAQYHLNVAMKYLQLSADQNYFLAARELHQIKDKRKSPSSNTTSARSDVMKYINICLASGNINEALKVASSFIEELKPSDTLELGYLCRREGYRYDSLKKYDIALKCYLLGDMVGNDWCAFKLGCYYRYGHGVAQNYAKAIEYYRHEYELGNYWGGAYRIAELYLEGGYGITASRSKAREWMKKAADKGNKDAKQWLQKNPY